MENNVCVFCGQELSVLNSKTVYCAATKQPACRACYKEMIPLSAEERARRALATSRARDREVLRAYLADRERHAQEKAAAEEQARKDRISDKLCPYCAVPMVKMGRKNFQMGEENFFIDTHLWEGSLEVDLIFCEKCRKVEFFLIENFDAKRFE